MAKDILAGGMVFTQAPLFGTWDNSIASSLVDLYVWDSKSAGFNAQNLVSLMNSLATFGNSSTKHTMLEMWSSAPEAATAGFAMREIRYTVIDILWGNKVVISSGGRSWGLYGNSMGGETSIAGSAGEISVQTPLHWQSVGVNSGPAPWGEVVPTDAPGTNPGQGVLKINCDNRTILGMPNMIAVNPPGLTDNTGFTVNTNIRVTIDDWISVTATPTPPPATDPVTGTKISELSPVTELDDTDLMVLSRDDNPPGGDYDSSNRILYSDIKGSLGTFFGSMVASAWVNFDGTGTPAIRAQHNVSSITDNGTGDYTVNFTSSLASSDYSVVATAGVQDAGAGTVVFCDLPTPGCATTGFRVTTRLINTGGVMRDQSLMCCAVFGP